MGTEEILVHYRAGAHYGRESACGNKINYVSISTGERAASKMSVTYNKDMEAYPCVWCGGVHIGRKMTEDEKTEFWVTYDL